MKIWIETRALAGPSDDLLWAGALFGLPYMQRFDHYFSFNIGDLSATQQKLLHHEELHTESFKREEADFLIQTEAGKLVLKNFNGETQSFDHWKDLSHALCFPQRKALLTRTTAETDITIELNLDGTGERQISTGLSFFDHMLQQIAKHGLMDLKLQCNGDLQVDEHHTIEDAAIALGGAITKALGDKRSIRRYAFVLPMDESAATVKLDLSGRPYLKFNGHFDREKVGDFPTEMTEHFFYSLAMNLKATLHISVEGKNEHHKIEACFKSFARCLRGAISRNERNLNILPSTKDLL